MIEWRPFLRWLVFLDWPAFVRCVERGYAQSIQMQV